MPLVIDRPFVDATCIIIRYNRHTLAYTCTHSTTGAHATVQYSPTFWWSLDATTVVSLASEQSVVSISSSNSLSASALSAGLPSCVIWAFSIREEGDWQVTRWSALWANRLTVLGCLGVAWGSGVGVDGGNSNQVIIHNCWINTFYGFWGQIPVGSQAPTMVFLVYAAAPARVTSL